MSELTPYNYDIILLYLHRMNEIKIIQVNICLSSENLGNQLLLIFTLDGKIIGVSIIPMPNWFKYWDEEFKYYQFCYN